MLIKSWKVLVIIKKLKIYLHRIKQNLIVLFYAYKDKRTPVVCKLIIGFAIGYMLSPIDLIPDFIPILGILDDLIIVPLLITLSMKLIPPYIIVDAKKNIEGTSVFMKKSNWFFGVIFILIWIVVIFYLICFIVKIKNGES